MKKKAIKEFESTKNIAELNALSKTSLKRELTDRELQRYRELARTEFGIGDTSKNVSLSLDVEDIYTKTVSSDAGGKGGRVHVHKGLVGKKVVVMSLKNGNKENTMKVKKTGKYLCKNCGGHPKITVPVYQRKNPSWKICKCKEPRL